MPGDKKARAAGGDGGSLLRGKAFVLMSHTRKGKSQFRTLGGDGVRVGHLCHRASTGGEGTLGNWGEYGQEDIACILKET